MPTGVFKRPTFEERFNKSYIPEPNTGCWLWLGSQYLNKYGIIRFEGRSSSAHRASYKFHRGHFDVNLFVCHRCDTPECVNPDHLFLGTHKENMADCIRKGRFNTGRTDGEFNPNCSLNKDDVLLIRTLHDKKKRNGRELAKRFGVTPSAICSIIKRRTWKHL